MQFVDLPGNRFLRSIGLQSLRPTILLGKVGAERDVHSMNRIFRLSHLTPYEGDYAQWCAEQGALLREGRLSDLDRENLAEEIESLGNSEESEIESRMGVLIAHLLKWRFQAEKQSNSWRGTIKEQRLRIARRIRKSPSLKRHPANVLTEEYEIAKANAVGETGLPEDAFPTACPFTIEQILDLNWLPEAAA